MARERTFTASQHPHRDRRPQERGRPTATTLLTGNPLSSPPRCCYCQQTHSSGECSTVTSASERKQILRTSGCCFNCLRKGHLVQNCRLAGKCTKCRERHPPSVCENREQPPSEAAQTDPVRPSTLPLNPSAPLFTSVSTVNNLCSSDLKTVLLQTARARVYNPANPHRSTELT